MIKQLAKNLIYLFEERASIARLDREDVRKVNLCCGIQKVPGYLGVDFNRGADLIIDLNRHDLPFDSNSLEAVACISAINYFTRSRAQEIINEVYRVLKPGGITRFATQDLENIAKRYVEKDITFFFQKLPNGQERFEGRTLGEKFAAWFYGYEIKGISCKYFYDYESLADLFKNAGFSIIDKKAYLESNLEHIELIDNRPEQMFFLEAVK